MSQRGVSGRVVAHFDAPHKRTRLKHLACLAPLKIAKPFPQSDGSLHVCLMDASPGLLAGDRYELGWHLENGAHALITHQGFTRVHPSKDSSTAHQQSISVAKGALLEYEAAPILLYREAALNAETHISVEQGGVLVMSEIVCAGRTGHNESFAFERYQGHLRADYSGELVAWNSVDLRPQLHNLRARGAWDSNTHWGTVLVVAENANKALQDTLRDELSALEEDLKKQSSGISKIRGGVGLSDHHTVTVSLLGNRAYDLEQAALRLRACARRVLRSEKVRP